MKNPPQPPSSSPLSWNEQKRKKGLAPSVLLRREIHHMVKTQKLDEALQRVWRGIIPLLVSSPSVPVFIPPSVSSLLVSASDAAPDSKSGRNATKDGVVKEVKGLPCPETHLYHGKGPPCCSSPPVTLSWSMPSVVFDWAAFTAVLYLCDIRGKPEEGIHLLHAVRWLLETRILHASSSSLSTLKTPTHPPPSCVAVPPSDQWMKDERFLSLVLRLQCAVQNEKEATHLISFLLQTNLLRSRTASTYLHFCFSSPLSPSCFPLTDRLHKAWTLYRESRKRQLSLSIEDITTVARLWVKRAEEVASAYEKHLQDREASIQESAKETEEEEQAKGKKRERRCEDSTEQPQQMEQKEVEETLSSTLEALVYLLEDLREQELVVENEYFLTEVLLPLTTLWSTMRKTQAMINGEEDATKRKQRVWSVGTLKATVFRIPRLPSPPVFPLPCHFAPATTPHSPREGSSSCSVEKVNAPLYSSSLSSPPFVCRPAVACCTCCGHALQKQPFTESQRTELLQQLEQRILLGGRGKVAAVARAPRASSGSNAPGFTEEKERNIPLMEKSANSRKPKKEPVVSHPGLRHWKRLLQQEVEERSSSSVVYDVLIDGANVGYYGVSKWAEVAPRLGEGTPPRSTSLQRRKENRVADATLSPSSCHSSFSSSSGRWHHTAPVEGMGEKGVPAAVNVQLDFALIDQALRLATTVYGFLRPLILLHARHCRPEALTRENAAFLKRWQEERVLYTSPFGCNDDAWWLYGALFLLPYHSSGGSPLCHTGAFEKGAESQLISTCTGVYVLTNDKCKDHHFQFLSPRCFKRWREQFCIRFHCVRENGVTHLRFEWPPAYSYAPQEVHWKEEKEGSEVLDTMRKPSSSKLSSSFGNASSNMARKHWCWHIPVRVTNCTSSLPSSSCPASSVGAEGVAFSAMDSHPTVDRTQNRKEKEAPCFPEESAGENVVNQTREAEVEEKWICLEYNENEDTE